MYGEIAMLNLGDVMNLTTQTDIPISGTEPTAYWTPENNPYTASDPTFGKLTLGANKLTALIRVSEELLQDSEFDIESYVAERAGIAFSRSEEDAFINSTARRSAGRLYGERKRRRNGGRLDQSHVYVRRDSDALHVREIAVP
jgi:HK97 family phage major capsid protein